MDCQILSYSLGDLSVKGRFPYVLHSFKELMCRLEELSDLKNGVLV